MHVRAQRRSAAVATAAAEAEAAGGGHALTGTPRDFPSAFRGKSDDEEGGRRSARGWGS